MAAVSVVCLLGDSLGLSASCDALGGAYHVLPRLCRCLVDSATHGVVSVLVLYRRRDAGDGVCQSAVHALFLYGCGVLVDVDHFLAAASLSLESATGLRSRPLGHCFTVVVALAACVYAVERLLLFCRLRPCASSSASSPFSLLSSAAPSSGPAANQATKGSGRPGARASPQRLLVAFDSAVAALDDGVRFLTGGWERRRRGDGGGGDAAADEGGGGGGGGAGGGGGWYASYFLLFGVLLHELRDSWRRGFWLCPLGAVPVSYGVYVVLTAAAVAAHDFVCAHRPVALMRPAVGSSRVVLGAVGAHEPAPAGGQWQGGGGQGSHPACGTAVV
jgi:hypothetical protein